MSRFHFKCIGVDEKRGIIKNLPVALCGVVTGPLGGLRHVVRRSPDSRDAHGVGLNHRRNRCETAIHATIHIALIILRAQIKCGV